MVIHSRDLREYLQSKTIGERTRTHETTFPREQEGGLHGRRIASAFVFRGARHVSSRWHNKLLTGFSEFVAENYTFKWGCLRTWMSFLRQWRLKSPAFARIGRWKGRSSSFGRWKLLIISPTSGPRILENCSTRSMDRFVPGHLYHVSNEPFHSSHGDHLPWILLPVPYVSVPIIEEMPFQRALTAFRSVTFESSN